jgi:hypothetical protein
MAMKEKHLATLYSSTGDNAVARANQTYSELKSMPLIERIRAAKDLPDVFMRAIIIDHEDAVTESAARAAIKSYFYVNSILTVDRAFHRIRQASKWLIEHIHNPSKLLRKVSTPLQLHASQGDSSPVEARSLPSEIKVMLKTILAAHAPTAAKERSSLQSISIS